MIKLNDYKILIDNIPGGFVDAVIYADDRITLEDEALSQLKNAARIPGVVKVIATPDIHTGFGVPIGSVIGMENTVIPAAVGYDVNCGMRILTTPLSKDDINLKQIAESIRRDIPLGEGQKNLALNRSDFHAVLKKGMNGIKDIKDRNHSVWQAFNDDEYLSDMYKMEDNGSLQGDPEALSKRSIDRGIDQLGTLGGGNHFIEIQEVSQVYDENIANQLGIKKWQIVIMIHSGSRGLGHQVGDDYMPMAKEEAKSKMPENTIGFFKADSKNGADYIGAMQSAANFAFVNRQIMALLVRKNFRHYFGDIAMPLIYDVPHNIAKMESYDGEQIWVHRKGATRAFPKKLMKGTRFANIGQPIIIPGSMGTASYLLIGTDSAKESLYSVNHGAGRVMSRTAAGGKSRRRDGKVFKEGSISDKEFEESMKNVLLICEHRGTIKEEAPAAYKDIDIVIDIVKNAGLANPVAKMKPLAVLKG